VPLSALPVAPQDAGVAVFGLAAATAWLKVWTTLAGKDLIDPKLSRKVVHSGSAPLFILTWPFFTSGAEARFVAAGVPLLMLSRLLLASFGKQPELLKAVSRSGDAKEAVGGPFLYVVMLLVFTTAYWRSSIIGVVALAQMAAGDGLADIVGRKVGGARWPFSDRKTYAGSLGFVLGGFTVSLGLVYWLATFSCVDLGGLGLADVAVRLAAVSVASALVELVPLGDDNVTVPLTAAVFTALAFGLPLSPVVALS